MNIQASLLRFGKQTEFAVRRNAPTILTSLGVAGFVATTGLAIRATAKCIDVMPEMSKRVQEARVEAGEEVVDSKDKKASEALAKAYLTNAVVLGKVYGPTLVVGSLSIMAVLSAHGIMLRRQATLVAAYSALDASFKAYRKRVADEIGVDKEIELYRRPTMRALDETDPGHPGEIIDMSDILPSPYARFFDESSPNWKKTAEYNLMFLRAQQDWANDRLIAHGFIFLNEVYEALGMDRSQLGQMVGWKKDSETGDGFVDFGLYAIGDEGNRAFVNLIEPVVLLDFNVDGPIKI